MPALETLKPLEGQAMTREYPCHRIGEAARLSGVPAASIRYYEKEGLLPEGARGDNRYRLYTDADVHRLRFVRLCRAMDMSLDEVRSLLALDGQPAGTGHAACMTLDEHLNHVRERLRELHALEGELQALRDRCTGSGGDCQVMAALHARADAQPIEAPASAPKRHV
jgi:DNA-binding transcriptional MerR regulator